LRNQAGKQTNKQKLLNENATNLVKVKAKVYNRVTKVQVRTLDIAPLRETAPQKHSGIAPVLK